MKKSIYRILFLLLSVSASVKAETWTLQQCIEHARENNLNLKIQRNMELKSEYDLRQSKWKLAPSINGYGSSDMNFQRGTNQYNQITSGTSYYVSYGISASLDIFAGFTKLNTVAAYRFSKLATSESTELSEILLEMEITDIYARTLYQKALINVAEARLETSRFEAERIAATIEAGQMEAVAQNEFNAIVSANLFEYNRATNDYLLLKLQLAQTIELPSYSDFEIADVMFEFTPSGEMLNSDSLYIETCMHYPSVLQKEYELEYYRKMLQIAKGNHSPSITASGGYSSNFFSTDTLDNGKQTPFGTQYNNFLNPSLGASISIPIFNGKARTYQTKKSRIDIENAMYSLEEQKKQIRKEIEEAVLKLHLLKLEYESANDNLKFTEESFEVYREKYRLGMINTTDFMTAQNQLSQAQVNLLLARYSWAIQKKTIDLYSIRN